MRIYHVDAKDAPKHRENSLRGIRYAARHGFDAIDLDLLITSDGVIVGTHWDRPMRRDGFHDPLHHLAHDRTVRSMRWDQIRRLRAGSRLYPYKISRVERLLAECARRGITALLEPKDDARFEEPSTWRYIKKVADDVGAHVAVYTLENFPTPEAGVRRAQAARSAGIRARTIR